MPALMRRGRSCLPVRSPRTTARSMGLLLKEFASVVHVCMIPLLIERILRQLTDLFSFSISSGK